MCVASYLGWKAGIGSLGAKCKLDCLGGVDANFILGAVAKFDILAG